MTRILAVCLGVMLVSPAVLGVTPAPESFALADEVGSPTDFFIFETSVGKFWIRRDGFGEILRQTKRHTFFVNGASKVSLDRLYFLEHEGDVLLFYELKDGSAKLVRFDPVKRRVRWTTPLNVSGVPVLDGGAVIIGATEISKADGHVVRQD